MWKNYFTFLICVLLGTFTFTSCSSESEEGGSKGQITIDGEGYRVEMAECSDGVLEEYAVAGCFFEAMLYGDEGAYYYTVELVGIYELDNLKKGDDVTDRASVYSFRSISHADFSRYEETGGRVIVKSVSNQSITLEFKNFTFKRSEGKESFIANGAIEYER